MQKAEKLNLFGNVAALYLKHSSLIRFAIVGCINTGVDFFTFFVLFSYAGADKMYCQAAGYTMGIINSFLMNKLWTFDSRKSPIGTGKQMLRFLGVNLASLGISLLGLNYFSRYYGLNLYTSKIIITIIAQIINYLGYKKLVFTSSTTSQDH
jgi:putative flippase GtrA